MSKCGMQLIASSELTAVIGMGATGLSVARFLTREKQGFMMLDTRQAPPNLERFTQEFPGVPYQLGPLSADTLCAASRIVLSPGVPLRDPAIQAAVDKGIPVMGDIQLFVDSIRAPLIAITGSNGKSTVTTLVGAMLEAAGKRVAVGGNLGTPALDLLEQPEPVDYYVLELSSFQLETTVKLNAAVATILNVSADHMDRYPSLVDYHAAKQRIYFGGNKGFGGNKSFDGNKGFGGNKGLGGNKGVGDKSSGVQKIVVNREDPLTQPPLRPGVAVTSFGLDAPDLKQFGLVTHAGESWLAFGLQKLIPLRELKLTGKHNAGNALAALAIGYQVGIPMEPMIDTLRTFIGLPHRCQWVASHGGVDFINDSKGTNVGATLAALQGLSRLPNKLVLIAGGEGKGADFSPLGDALRDNARALIGIGTDGPALVSLARENGVDAILASDMTEAVSMAISKALPGDAVVLSPACASFDMFENYEDRGRRFIAAVNEVAA